jgi:predicted HTH transcriptional regulator
MSEQEIERAYATRIPLQIGNIRAPYQDLTFRQLKIHYEGRGLVLNDQTFLRNLELCDQNGVINYAGYLLSDANNASIRVAKYAGKNKVNLIDNAEYGRCNLITATNRVLERMLTENRTFTRIGAIHREERQMVESSPLREAIVNAIVHNLWTGNGTPQIDIYSDRITVTSAGGLPPGLSRESFLQGISVPRNRELMRVFHDVELVEQLGSGMNRILEAYDASVFEILPDFLIVNFPFAEGFEVADKIADKLPIKLPIDLTTSEESFLSMLLPHFETHEWITNAAARELSGLADGSVKRFLRNLTDKQVLEAVGENKSRKYRLRQVN